MALKTVALFCLFGILGTNANPVGTCPSLNGDYVDFLTHSTDCSKFYKCDWGKPVLYDCPAGLHFNPTLNVCDWPAAAGCGGSGTQSTTPVPKPTTEGDGGKCASVSCPSINGEFPVFHSHPEDCGRYCVCDWGVAYDMPCPDGLHFNTDLNVCDWPAAAGCDGSGEQTTTESSGDGDNHGKCGSVSCPAENGEFPVFHKHPEDCGRYCVCDWGVAYDMECPAGLHFNTDLNVCDWPAAAGCDGSGEQTTTESDGDGDNHGKCGSVSCPAENGEFPVFHKHPEDCGRYCVCDWGVAYDMECPAGLHFNTDLNVCDWPAAAGCDGSTPKPDPTSTPSTTQSTTTHNPGKCGTVSCPAENGEFPVFHKHPEDCGRYCVCDWGLAYDMECPAGLHFNTELNVCDWPQDAGCDGSIPTPSSTPTTPSTTQSTTTHNPGKCGTVSCPAENGEFPVFHKHPEDCGRYCVCDWGLAYDMECPAGLHFNTDLNVCDWPAAAGCDGSTPKPDPTSTPSTTQSTTTHNPGKCGTVSCPAENGEFPVFHKHPEDCGRYCVCDWGLAYDMECPAGLHFNTELNVCDWPQDAGCDGSIPTSSSTPTTPSTTQSTTTHNPGKCGTVSCPAENGEFPVFHKHPEDCGRYCVCDWGLAYDMECPAGLHFNTELNVCDWPQDAGCDGSIPTSSSTPTTPSTTQSTTTHNPGKCGTVSCPAENGEFPVFHKHPEDCGRYCVCDWGLAYDMECPAGLHFNTELNVCDWPQDAGCDGSPTKPDPTPTTPSTTQSTTTHNPGKCGTVSCPAENGEFPVFHKHPEDCGRYCVCDWGLAYDMECPAGLHFNTELNVCDWPQDAGCDGSPTKPDPTPTTPSTTQSTTTHNPGKCGTVSCPAENGEYPVFHKHPEDCGRYCVCDWGLAYDMECPDGLHFNTELNVCDWPKDAGCDGSGPGETSTPSPVPTGDCSGVSCPQINGKYPVFHSHPKECGRYCKCDWGVAFDMPCPVGLHFNPSLNVCDWPHDAGCPHN